MSPQYLPVERTDEATPTDWDDVVILEGSRFDAEWETRRLGSLGTFAKGKGIARGDLRETGPRCVRYGELYTRYENYVASPESRIPQSIAGAALPIKKGDLLFAGSGETADEIGICVAYIGDEPAYAGGDIIVLRASGQDPVYLAHVLNASAAARQKTRMAQGDAIVHIRADHLARIELALPPFPEQRAIAAVLLDVDVLIESLEALIAKKRAIKRAAMQQFLTGRMRLPGFEGEWERVALGVLAEIRNGGTPSTTVPDYWDGDVPWCTPTDITGTRGRHLTATTRCITISGLNSCGASLLPAGALLLCSRATIGELKIAAMPVATNQGFKSLVCGDSVYHEYLYYRLLLLKETMTDLATGSTFLEISKRDVANIRIFLPPLSEQQAIAAILTDMDAEIAALERRLDKTRAIKQGMMQQLLTGSIRLPIPDDATDRDAHDA